MELGDGACRAVAGDWDPYTQLQDSHQSQRLGAEDLMDRVVK